MYIGSELWKNRVAATLVEEKLDSGEVILTYPDLPVNLYAAVREAARKHPDKTAVEDSFGQRLSYGELEAAADRFAAALKHQLKVGKGDHVALMMYSSAAFCAAFLALVKLGAIAVMLPTKYRKKEIHALVDKADLSYVICDTDFLPCFEEYREAEISFVECHESELPFAFDKRTDKDCPQTPMEGGREDVLVMMFTSGTTSSSKGVMITNYAYMHALATYKSIFALTEADSTIIPVPIYMITGLSALLGAMLYAGGTVYMQQFFHAKEVLGCIRDKNVTFIHAAPTVYSLLVEQREHFPAIESLRCAACGGSRVSMQIIEKLHDWLPDCDFRTVYGMTETASPATILPENAVHSMHMESNGIPIPGMMMKAVDEDGNELAPTQTGEILMKGTNLLQGYYKLEGLATYRDGWFHTGDVGYFTEDGYCYVVDRIKDMINRGGEKIISSDVEKELLAIEGVADAAVVGIPHEIYGEAPAAVVKPSKDGCLDAEVIRQRLKKCLAGYKIPEKIRIVDQIPLTPNGKIDKKRIKNLFSTD